MKIASADERIDDVHVLVAEFAAEFFKIAVCLAYHGLSMSDVGECAHTDGGLSLQRTG